MTKLGMVIDLSRCVGCNTCAVACKEENDEPLGIWWNRVLTVGGGDYIDVPEGEYPDVGMHYLPLACQHCENAPCVKVCPVSATYKRTEDGVVLVDFNRCIGCRYCMAACPYGVRNFNWGEPVYSPGVDFPVGHQGDHYDKYNPDRLVYMPERPKGVVEKCTFCVQRIDNDEIPFCVETCPEGARIFGDLDDPNSEVSQVIMNGNAEQLLPELGTDPQVFYVPPYQKKDIIPPYANQSSLAPEQDIIAQAEQNGYVPGFENAVTSKTQATVSKKEDGE